MSFPPQSKTSRHVLSPAPLAMLACGLLALTIYSQAALSQADRQAGLTQPEPAVLAPGVISTFAGNGVGAFSGDGHAATQAELSSPQDVVFDASGNAYIADYFNSRVRKVAAGSGVITTIAGGGSCAEYEASGYCGDGGQATKAALFYPQGLALDSSGNLYIADAGENAVRKVNLSSGIITSVAGFPVCDAQACGPGTPGFGGDGGKATEALLNGPRGVAVDSAGNVYIADTLNNRIRVVSTAGIIATYAGGGSGCAAGNPWGDGCPATDATLYYPFGLAFDSSGNLYFADSGCLQYGCDVSLGDLEIRKINVKTKIVSAFAGGNSSGCTTSTDGFGDGCPATEAFIASPSGIAFDSFGDLFVADNGDDSVREVNAFTNIIATVAGGNGPGFTGTGKPATQAQLNLPVGVALDPSGNFYIADSGNNVIREVGYSAPVAPTPVFSPVPGIFQEAQEVTLSDAEEGARIYYTTNGENPTAASAEYGGAIAVTETTTIKAIAKSPNAKLSLSAVATGVFSIATKTATTVASSANPAKIGGSVTFTATVKPVTGAVVPTGTVAFTVDGQNYGAYEMTGGKAQFSDSGLSIGTHTILATYSGDPLDFASSGKLTQTVTTLGVTAAPTFSPATGPFTQQQYIQIKDATAGATIYYTTNGNTPTVNSQQYYGSILINKSTTIKAIAVGYDYTQSAVSTGNFLFEAPAAPVFSPVAGTYDTSESVTLTDATKGARIYYTTNGSAPTQNSNEYFGPIAVNQTTAIKAIAYTTPYVFSTVATAVFTIGPPPAPTFSPKAGSYTAAENIVLADAAKGANIYYTLDGSTPTRNSHLYSSPIPISDANVTIDAIAVTTPNTQSAVAAATYTFVPAAGSIATIAGDGYAGDTGNNGQATSAELNYPAGVAVDSAGNVYFADLLNNVVRKVTAATGVITTIAGNGVCSYFGDTGLATKAELCFYPQVAGAGKGNGAVGGVAVDAAGNVYIADSGNYRIRKVAAATGIITTIAGTGKPGFSGDKGAATAAQISAPNSLAADAAGDVFIADNLNNRIRKVSTAGIITTVAGDGTASFFGDKGLATAAELSNPTNVAVDTAGNLYIADQGNSRVRKVAAATGVIATVAGSGTYTYSGDNGLATSAGMTVNFVAVDTSGDLYIGDYYNNRIRGVSASTGIVTTVAGDGFGGFAGDFGPATSARIDNSTGIAAHAGNLFIADTFNQRIREVTTVAK